MNQKRLSDLATISIEIEVKKNLEFKHLLTNILHKKRLANKFNLIHFIIFIFCKEN